MNESSCVFEIIDQTIKSSENRLSVKELCKTAGVSRSGYYAWVKAAPAREGAEEQDQRDFALILEAYKVRGYKKGAESIHMNLLHMDPPVVMNLKKIRRLMKKFGLICPVRKANAYRRIGNGCLLEPEPSRVLASRLIGVGAAGEIEGETGRILSQEEFFPPACQPVSPQPVLIVGSDTAFLLEPGDEFFPIAGTQVQMRQHTGAALPGNGKSYFYLDSSFDFFHYIPDDSTGEAMIRLLCSPALQTAPHPGSLSLLCFPSFFRSCSDSPFIFERVSGG